MYRCVLRISVFGSDPSRSASPSTIFAYKMDRCIFNNMTKSRDLDRNLNVV
jgi:hypothetical protein